MKFIEGIVAVIQGNAKEKLNDPLIGSFIASFILWNWNRFLLLFFGNKEMDERITDCVTALTISFDSWAKFFSSLCIYVVPIFASIFYVFLMPRISIWMSGKLQPLEIGKHTAAVDLEIAQAVKQQELNKQKLLSDPTKTFLPKLVEQDIKQKELDTEKLQVETDKAKDEAAKAKADKEAAEANKQKAIKEDEVQRIKSEHEKKRIAVGVAITNSMLSANAYLSCFNFIRLLSKSLADDGIALTYKSLTEIIAAVFGYKNFDDLLDDKSFHNEGLKKLKYVLLDSEYLSGRIVEVLSEDIVDEDVCNVDHVMDHLILMFEKLPYLLGDEETIAEAIFEELEIDAYSLINEEEVADAIADTDTLIEEIELYSKSVDVFDNGLEIRINGTGSGTHRKESDVKGQGINITLTVAVPALWGKYGLGDYSKKIDASPESFDEEWPEDVVEMEK
ncbi:MAG: hypothetical protein ACI9DG_001880 [Oleispira sp.]|jgi:hypothetical protein